VATAAEACSAGVAAAGAGAAAGAAARTHCGEGHAPRAPWEAHHESKDVCSHQAFAPQSVLREQPPTAADAGAPEDAAAYMHCGEGHMPMASCKGRHESKDVWLHQAFMLHSPLRTQPPREANAGAAEGAGADDLPAYMHCGEGHSPTASCETHHESKVNWLHQAFAV